MQTSGNLLLIKILENPHPNGFPQQLNTNLTWKISMALKSFSLEARLLSCPKNLPQMSRWQVFWVENFLWNNLEAQEFLWKMVSEMLGKTWIYLFMLGIYFEISLSQRTIE